MLVLAVNSLLYLNQSFPPFGVSLNSLTNGSTDFILKPQPGVKIALDCAQTCFIASDKLVLSLKGGELYVLTLIVDGMRAVRSFHMDKAAASVLTTCMCECGDGFIFLGSRLGNSLLLKYTKKILTTDNSSSNNNNNNGNDNLSAEQTDEQQGNDNGNAEVDEPALKKRKQVLEWKEADMSFVDDLDELEVYGSDPQQSAGSQVTQYTFEVCDSLINIGPCGQMVIGEPACLSEEFSGSEDHDMELVTTSGYGKNGAITVLQRSIRPQVVTTFELPGCTDMWTVVGGPVQTKSSETNESLTHSLLILSRDDGSMILKTGQEIMELDQSGFNTHGPTVYAGNIGDNQYIIQVTARGIRLLDGITQLQNLALDVNCQVVSCSVADPHAVLITEDGQVLLVTLRPAPQGTGQSKLTLAKPPQTNQTSPVITLCAYKDVSGIFSLTPVKQEPLKSTNPTDHGALFATNPLAQSVTLDEEDELLYGPDSDLTVKSETPVEDKTKPVEQDSSTTSSKRSEIVPTYWVILCRANGDLEVC